MSRLSDPAYAALLSLILPGAGQFVAGRVGWGLFWLVATPGFWVLSGGVFGWACHLISAFQAWRQNQPIPQEKR